MDIKDAAEIVFWWILLVLAVLSPLIAWWAGFMRDEE
jgi:hypothetical protein